MDNFSADTVRAVDRALYILLAFREGEHDLSATELLTRLPLTRPTLYRLLHTLVQAGFVHTSGEPQRFRLGGSVGQLARVWASFDEKAVDLPAAAQPMMRRLRQHTGETVAVFIPDGNFRVCIAELASEQPLSFKRGVGYRERIMLGASGRAILAHLPHGVTSLEAYANDFPAGSSIDLKRYAHELKQTRKRGYAVSRSELTEGAVAMAAPFFGSNGHVNGSLAVFGPTVRLDNARVKETSAILVEEANALSCALGLVNRRIRAATDEASAAAPPPLKVKMS
jgi:IclR family acetate operon transcriptional repressor